MSPSLPRQGCMPVGAQLIAQRPTIFRSRSSVAGVSLGSGRPTKSHTSRSLPLVCRAGDGTKQQAKVAVAPGGPAPPRLPPVRPLSWAFAAGLLTISVAALSMSRSMFRAVKKSSAREAAAAPPAPLTSAEEAAAAAMGPLLLAAETAAGVDETVHLSQEDLEKLETNLRMLITSMDAQLAEAQEAVAAAAPAPAVAALDAVIAEAAGVEDALEAAEAGSDEAERLEEKVAELRWEAFGAVAGAADAETKRTYRSLLYNRGVQAQLLRQVERQLALRAKMAAVQVQLEALGGGGDAAAADAAPALRLALAGAAVPHPKKHSTGGEDAFFCSPELGAFGVADGVGGWASLGVDPSQYPRLLMAACEAGAARHGDPLAILTHAYEEAHAPGSCTCALAALDGAALRVASLGDCGTRVVRGGRVIFATAVQEHRFNQPFQIGSPQFHPGNIPGDAHRYEVALQPGDVVVMGSDGLWDNLWDHELEAVVAEEEVGTLGQGGGDGAAAQQVAAALAARLAALAAAHAQDRGYASPFAAERHERTVPEAVRGIVTQPRGGKLDDVTAVAAVAY